MNEWSHQCKGAGRLLLIPAGEMCDRCGMEPDNDAPALGMAVVVSKTPHQGDVLGRCFDCMWSGKSSCPHVGVQACRACGGKGYTNEGDPEIGNALFDCEACGGSGGVPAGAVLPVSAMAVAPAVSRAQVSSRVDPSACPACVGAGVELEGVNAGRACATCGGTGDACGVAPCDGGKNG